MTVNPKYKDSVFSFLFSDPDVLRELYSALEGVKLPPDIPVTINTLENVLFMDLYNDISFEIGGKLVVLIEHQSTINPNVALRLLMYIARVYEKMFGGKSLYSGKRLFIPKPEFFVLYNGVEFFPDEKIIRLSDNFRNVELMGLTEKNMSSLDLELRVININEGRNKEIAARSRELTEYSSFIAKVRSYGEEMGDREAAMKAAIKYCLEHGILSKFLEKHSREVFNMLITEWNTEEAKEVWYEEGLEKGLEEGMEKGREEGMERGREEIARNALLKGLSINVICDITGLDVDTIKKIDMKVQKIKSQAR